HVRSRQLVYSPESLDEQGVDDRALFLGDFDVPVNRISDFGYVPECHGLTVNSSALLALLPPSQRLSHVHVLWCLWLRPLSSGTSAPTPYRSLEFCAANHCLSRMNPC